MQSFASLYKAKLETIRALEGSLPLQPFTREAQTPRYARLTSVDSAVAVVLLILFGALMWFKTTG